MSVKSKVCGVFYTPVPLDIQWIIEDIAEGRGLGPSSKTIFDLMMAGF
jgi:hypothetical protein